MTISFNIVTGITGIPKPGSSESSPQKNTRRARSPAGAPRNSSKVDEKLASSFPLEFLIQLCKIRDKSPLTIRRKQ